MRVFFAMSAVGCVVGSEPEPEELGGQIGEESVPPACVPTGGSRPIGLDDDLGLGFTGQDLVDTMGGAWVGPLTWEADGAVTELALDPVVVGARALEFGWERDPDSCGEQIFVDVDLGFVTADGGLDDRFEVTLSSSPTRPALTHEPVSGWGGTFVSPVPGAPLSIYADIGQGGDRLGDVSVGAGLDAVVVARWGEPF